MFNGNWPTLAVLAIALASQAASAQTDRTIRILVPFSAGGGADSSARAIAQQLALELGETVIVENKPGAGGNIAMDQVIASPPDGRTMGLSTNSIVINPLIYAATTRFDAQKSFTPIAMLGTSPVVLVARTTLPANNLKELLAQLKASPGKITYASCGNGSIHQLAGEAFKSKAGVDMTHIPYKGCSTAITDVIGGQVDLGMISLTTARPFIDARKVKVLAVTSDRPSPLLPNVPSLASLGLKDYSFDGWYGLVAAPGTPEAVVRRLNTAINNALGNEEVRKQFATSSIHPTPGTAAAFGALIAQENARYSQVIKAGNIKGD